MKASECTGWDGLVWRGWSKLVEQFFFSLRYIMPLPSSLADIAQKSAVLFLAGTTVYYMVNVGYLVNRRMELKKQGKLEEELARLHGNFLGDRSKSETSKSLHAETVCTPTPLPNSDQPGNTAVADES
ncbi:hypothetical protein VTP01DRAFT_6318 [Rhizomucor pusillus]|uniref:uncharacterized protein n=1 Tax=Rhizomucor pusillus TaxID=4840 RepID=UPI003743A7B2